ncbi:WhiB family transcriptional regulator [Streptomyces glaucescens]|uniref:WhiB family transcriptional regulator n=1 Tax=Streptomyces glaucescens TaxID=1907 RepID=UPI00344BF459
MSNWREQAACHDEDPDLFFPIGTSGPALMQTEQAKAVCRRCPVREPCLEFALDTGQTLGVWGGTGEAERRALQRRRKARHTG